MSIKKILAEYTRLSQEDENEGESNSIINQRELLNAFVKSSLTSHSMKWLSFAMMVTVVRILTVRA